MNCVRAADPATLFRGDGRTIGDIARQLPVPDWVPDDMRVAYQLTSLFCDEHSAAKEARSALDCRERFGRENRPENSARVALGPYNASSPACIANGIGSG